MTSEPCVTEVWLRAEIITHLSFLKKAHQNPLLVGFHHDHANGADRGH